MLQHNETARDNNSEPALKPMRFADILDTTFSLYRKHFGLFLGLVSFGVFGDLTFHLLTDFSQFFFDRSLLLPMFCPIGPPFHIVGKVLCKQWRRVLS